MRGSAHLIVGTGVSLALVALLRTPIMPAAAAVAAVSSLLPDIDEPNALLVNRALPKPVIRALQLALLLTAAAVAWLAASYAPWNWAAGGALALTAFSSSRKLRHLLMLIIGAGLLVGGWYGGLPWLALAGGLLVGCVFLPHRGFTHTFYAAALWTGILYGIAPEHPAVWQAGGLAYALHLLADALTRRGIQPLPPLPFKLCIPLMRTGKTSGAFIETLCIGATFIFAYIVFVELEGWRLWSAR